MRSPPQDLLQDVLAFPLGPTPREAQPQRLYRLVGIGLSNFRDAEETTGQPALFE